MVNNVMEYTNGMIHNRTTRVFMFIIFVFIILKAVERITVFFEMKSDIGYTYFAWLSIVAFLFAWLPIDRTKIMWS